MYLCYTPVIHMDYYIDLPYYNYTIFTSFISVISLNYDDVNDLIVLGFISFPECLCVVD